MINFQEFEPNQLCYCKRAPLSSVIYRGFKDYTIHRCCFSAKHAVLRSNTGWLGIRRTCPYGAPRLPMNCGFGELALKKSLLA